MMNIAVILAAGKGTRIKHADKPKQFLDISGKPILCHTVDKFIANEQIGHIVVAVHKDWIPYAQELLSVYGNSRISICEGGGNRQESLYKAVIFCKDQLKAPVDTVIVSHDAARLFVTHRIIKDSLTAIERADAVSTVIPSIDTLIQSVDGKMMSDVTERHQMYQVQTPQVFRLGKFIEIYQSLDKVYLDRMTDAIRLLFEHGCTVCLIQGEVSNFKVTTDYDFDVACYLMKEIKT